MHNETSPAFKENVTFSYTNSDGGSGTSPNANISNPKTTKSFVGIEWLINEKVYSLFTEQIKEYDAGTDSTANLDHGNWTAEKYGISLLIPLFNDFQLLLIGDTFTNLLFITFVPYQ